MLGLIAVDTETHGGSPWSIQVSIKPHTGVMVLMTDTEAVAELARQVNKLVDAGWTLVFHHCIADLGIAETVRIKTHRMRDTLQEAYHLASLPQGLKPLAYRLLGVTMRSWSDVVWPASISAISSWMEDAIGLAETNLQDMTVTHLKVGVCRWCRKRGKSVNCKVCGGTVLFERVEYTPSAAQNILRHVLTYTAKTEEEDEPYDPWKALERMRVEGLRGRKAETWEWEYLEGELGPIPILSIANVPLDQAVEYGCSDSDHTGQVAVELERLRGSERWRVDEGDYDR